MIFNLCKHWFYRLLSFLLIIPTHIFLYQFIDISTKAHALAFGVCLNDFPLSFFDYAEVTRQAITNWERGYRGISISNAKKLAKALECSIDDIV